MLVDISVLQLALIALMAVLSSIIGGLAGYGTGALMPLVLVPIVGPEPVVPTIAFRAAINWRCVAIVLVAAVPTCILGAWGYTTRSGSGVLILIGTVMVAS